MKTLQQKYENLVARGSIISGGWCQNFKTFQILWDQMSQKESVTLLIRNFSHLQRPHGPLGIFHGPFSGLVGAVSPELRFDYPGRPNEIYVWYPDLKALSPELFALLETAVGENGMIGARSFLDLGPQIARVLSCKVTITWQQGGDPENASYNDLVFQP